MMKKVAKIKNRFVFVLAMLLCVALCGGIFSTSSTLKAYADGFSNEAPAFNNIEHVGGTYVISETNGVNVKFENETSELVYSKEIDITQFNGNQEFIKFYVKPLGDRRISFYVDIIDSEDPENVLSVQINSKDGGSTHDSSISACVPSIGQLYTGYFFGNPNNARVNSLYTGHRKYSNITISNETNRTAYCSVHFGFDNSTNKIYTTIGDNPYNSTNNKLVCELSDTERVISNYFLHDGTVDDRSQLTSNKKGTFDVAWEGFQGSTVTVKMRVVGRQLTANDVVDSENPVEIYIATIGNAPVDTEKLSFDAIKSNIDVIYSMGGGTNNSDNPDTITSDEEVVLKDATRSGYKFLGWYTSADFAESSKVTVIPTDAGNEVVLYARFTKIYTITYNLDGGTNSADNVASGIEGDVITLKDAVKEGYTFEGWYTSSDFADGTKVSSITVGTDDITLYAKFASNSGSGCGSSVNVNGIMVIAVLSVVCAAMFVALKSRKRV